MPPSSGGSPDEYRAGIDRAISNGWSWRHESGTYLKSTPAGAELFREADTEMTDYETVIRDLLSGQYTNPVRVVSFNTAEGWSRDVSADIAEELRQRCDMVRRELPASLRGFFERFDQPSATEQRQPC